MSSGVKRYQPRDDVVGYLRSTLIGPAGCEHEMFEGTPLLRYMSAILFPQGTDATVVSGAVSATAEDSGAGEAGTDDDAPADEQPIELAGEMAPSAVGISFRIPDDAVVTCHVRGARYIKRIAEGAKARSTQVWEREPLSTLGGTDSISISKGMDFARLAPVFGGLGRVSVRWRSRNDGTAIVTVALVNQQVQDSRGLDPSKAFFQVGLRCGVDGKHQVLPYPTVGLAHGPSSEEAEVEFLYRYQQPFARGHGAAATWDCDTAGACKAVEVDFMPHAEVPYATFALATGAVDGRCLDLEFIDTGKKADVLAAFRSLAAEYQAWVHQQQVNASREVQEDVATRLVQRAAAWAGRMESGIAALERDEDCWQSFRTANRAMGMQMVFYGRRRKQPYPRTEGRRQPDVSLAGLAWRPFQVAFILGILESLAFDDSRDRDLVDVIWFPTGGGKTEAYLLAVAFELVRRRLAFRSSDTATAVLSRYTYRFLTAQQFQRTAALVVALEAIRRKDDTKLGRRAFSLGLWVGKGVTPNNFRVAHEWYVNLLESKIPQNPFILTACPCCNTEIVPERAAPKRRTWHATDVGIRSTDSSFSFYCPSDACEFHGHIPANVVDEALYQEPPSILLGTMDKFAQLPWDDRSRAFFGGPADQSPPPSLILQDELHLISGPLGSLAAPYEAAIDTVIELRGGRAKRIASTATIRNAAEQVRGLYGLRVAVFPAPCGSWDNAFFFRTDLDRPGRMYVGAMGGGYVKPVVAMAWTSAAILQATMEVKLDDDALDAYWTLLAYHNSRRELGRTLTAARDEIATRVAVIASSPAKVRLLKEPLELSAGMGNSLTEATAALEQRTARERSSVDLVPCTSIISVGVDIDRLGIMLVNGQPKLSSEYIQATSRVGRGKVPGLVVTLFSPSKPRDRSHYEDFRAYHESINRFVEPTSVTAYALPARQRTMHAALVTVVRHALRWRAVHQAREVRFEDPAAARAVARLLERMIASDPTEAGNIEALLKSRMEEWMEIAESGTGLYYEAAQAGMQFDALLCEYGRAPGRSHWPTMRSMRNVDPEVPIRVA